jgi:hypothetical protein
MEDNKLQDLVSFGNYMISTERKNKTDELWDGVSHADLENWKEIMKQLKGLYND